MSSQDRYHRLLLKEIQFLTKIHAVLELEWAIALSTSTDANTFEIGLPTSRGLSRTIFHNHVKA
jgi:hypothetical protein